MQQPPRKGPVQRAQFVPDPLADVEITDEQFKGFELNTTIAKIPADLWQRWVQLAFTLTERNRNNLEVSCRLLRHEDDRSQWRILIPKQEVSGASVRVESFDHAVDIVSGEMQAYNDDRLAFEPLIA